MSTKETQPGQPPERGSLLRIIRGLMLADHLGDVHDEMNLLCDLAGIPRRTGGYEEGWSSQDWRSIGIVPEEDEEE
jgi:hypothetical protein